MKVEFKKPKKHSHLKLKILNKFRRYNKLINKKSKPKILDRKTEKSWTPKQMQIKELMSRS